MITTAAASASIAENGEKDDDPEDIAGTGTVSETAKTKSVVAAVTSAVVVTTAAASFIHTATVCSS